MKDITTRFARDYADARAKFLAAVALTGGKHRAYVNPNKGPTGESLTTDCAWYGPGDARAVLVTISATHGAEGFCGSGAQVDWLLGPGPAALPKGVAMLVVHAINPHGFAWLRRVTEEGCDLNRNFVDFTKPLPQNPGYDEIADVIVPREITGPVFEAAEATLKAFTERVGRRASDIARSGGQHKHPSGLFYGGTAPTWARRTLEAIIADYDLQSRACVGVIDYHTGLGPFGYGEPICGNLPDTPGEAMGRAWYGESLTSPLRGTSASVPKTGMQEELWIRLLGDKVSHMALEYGTYPPDAGRAALREDHWLHAYTNVDWNAAQTRRIKAAIKKYFYPETRDWQEAVLWRSGQCVGQALRGLAAAG